jgi:glucose-6-phosphate 1-dehydrogenase
MESHADLLVIFGITGDLARRMTFRALYRLERRGGPGPRSSALAAAVAARRRLLAGSLAG